jgi:hypothetical protein
MTRGHAPPRPPVPAARPDRDQLKPGGNFMITANYPDRLQKVAAIMKSVTLCPVFRDEFPPGDELSAQATAKSPSSGNSP